MMRRAALALLLCGCGWSGPGPGRGGPDRNALTLANRGGYARARLESAVLESYLDVHPGIHVVQQHPSPDPIAYRRTLLDAMLAGRPPDVVLLDLADLPALADRGVLLDLGPYLTRVGVTLEEYDSTVLSAFRRGRGVYALPTGYSPLVVVYNKNLFDRAGLSGPVPAADWTWDEFLSMAQRLTRDSNGDGTIDQWGTEVDRRVDTWLAWVWAGGGDVLCADGKRATGCLDSPATIAALRWYAAWVNEDRIAPPPPGGDGLERFLSGQVAMLTVEHSSVPQLRARSAAGGLRVGVTMIPHLAGVPPATVLSARAYAVPALALRRKLAVALVASLTDSLAGRVRGEAGVELPALSGVAIALAARDTLGWEAAFLGAALHGRIPWEARVARWGEVELALVDLMDRLVAGADPEAAAHDMAQRLDHLLGAAR
jgi:ABC-type glycerol-3-phosphate transport system substrate-binding protein